MPVTLIALSSLCGAAFAANPPASNPATAPRLTGTFIQLLDAHGRWGDLQWTNLFEALKSMGIRDLVVQWSVLDGSAYYSSRTLPQVANAPLEKLLDKADQYQMKVLVGLAHDSDYWTNIQKAPAEAQLYLVKLRARSIAVANELSPILKKHPSFNGWYIPEEVDDVNWRAAEPRNILIQHLSALGTELRRLAPSYAIAISTYSQAQSSPQFFGQFWDEVFRKTPVSLLFFQDGVGVSNLELNELPAYLASVRASARANERKLQVVVELFRQVAGPPIDKAEFRAVPGPLDRICEQLTLAAEYSDDGITGFSVPEYMSPLGMDGAAELLSGYRAVMARGGK